MLPATVARLSRVAAHRRHQGSRRRQRARARAGGAAARPEFRVLSGDDLTAREAIGVGAAGVISVIANRRTACHG